MMDECWGHDLNDFGDGHPIVDFTGKPRMILGVPFVASVEQSNDLQSFHISNQHGFAVLGHLVLGAYLGHGLGVFGLKDSSEQGPVHGPRLDGFGAVGLAARHALLADVYLPAAEIGGGWFHGLGVLQRLQFGFDLTPKKFFIKTICTTSNHSC